MNLLDVISRDVPVLRKVAGTHGGEYAGPCPWCGGTDRFRIWPAEKDGRYWCRGCGKRGDAIQYLRDTKGLSYREACEQLHIEAKANSALSHSRVKPAFTPRETVPPPPFWSEKAAVFLYQTQQTLWSAGGMETRSFLSKRGLSEETIKRSGVGWNTTEAFISRERWGLPEESHENGKKKRLWLPAGLVIPCWDRDRLIRLRIRRVSASEPRYVVVSGSAMAPMSYIQNQKTIMVVESELDAILIHQEAGDIVDVVALGSVSARPDVFTHEALRKAARILVALDADKAGARVAWDFWPEAYGAKAMRWPVPIAKDPGEAWQKGLDILAWVEAGS